MNTLDAAHRLSSFAFVAFFTCAACGGNLAVDPPLDGDPDAATTAPTASPPDAGDAGAPPANDAGSTDGAPSATSDAGPPSQGFSGLFATGVDGTGAPLADGAVDPHYFLSSDDPSSPGPDAIAVTQDPTPNSGTTGWTPDTATSKWITVGSGANVGNPDMYTYSYATTFTLSAADASTASLSGIWACDDSCSMQLNGTPVATYPVPAWTAQPFAIAAGSPFRAGANTLTVVVSNSGAYATGLQIVSIQGSVGAPAPLAPPQDGLVGWWTFDDPGPIVRDASGHGNDGLAQGNLTQVPGRVGQAYALAGGCIGVPSSPSLAMAGGNQVTMMAWVEPATECSDTVAPGNCEFLNKENTYEMAQGAGTGSGGDPASQSVLGGFGEAIQRSDGYWFWNEQQPNVIAVGTWQHVAVTWDGTTVTRYLDGAVLVDPSNPRALDSSLTFAGNDTGLGIGCRDVAPDGTITLAAEGAFTGIVDEAAVYDRALSPAEIAAYYAATR